MENCDISQMFEIFFVIFQDSRLLLQKTIEHTVWFWRLAAATAAVA